MIKEAHCTGVLELLLSHAMEFSRLGRTGLHVSRLCLGTMTFGFQCDEETSRAILDAAAEGGISFIDTADHYPGGPYEILGRSEEILGRWLAGRRDQVVLASKCVGAMGPYPWNKGASRRHILDAVDASLRRLGTDYIDVYQLHHYDATTPIDESISALDHLVRVGKVRYVGCSNFLAYQLARAVGRAETLGLARMDSVQPRYNLLFRQVERELLPLGAEEGIGVIPYNPLAGGMLSGKHRRESSPGEGRFAMATTGKVYQDRYWNDQIFDTVAALSPLADKVGVSLATLAVQWVLANPVVTSAIIGASRPDQLTDCFAAAEAPLDAALKAELDQLSAPYRLGDGVERPDLAKK
jgi:aryl-alcohol dehydrogenase-like predicted oxidoreductase